MFRNQSVNVHQFSMVPRADIPRAAFNIEFTHKTTFDSGYLIPIMVEEVLPGDSFKVNMTAFARLATPIFPLMDNLHLDTFFFFVPNRLVWDNWPKFMGEQLNPGDSTDYIVPWTWANKAGGWEPGSLADYFGIPVAGQLTADMAVISLPFRAYNLIYNEWFRDQNLCDRAPVPTGDGPDDGALNWKLLRRAKRPDYFTSCLPWPQKGESVMLPLGTFAPVVPEVDGTSGPAFKWTEAGNIPKTSWLTTASGTQSIAHNAGASDNAYTLKWDDTGLVVDLSSATASTVNALRQSFQVQKLLERDARGGTRYTELIRAHFGVMSPDARLQRPEYLGGSSTPVHISPIPQTSGTATAQGGYTDTPQGNLAAMGTCVARASFSQAFTEHGYIIGLVNVRADVTYQQGLRRMWFRTSRYEFYFPVFAMLGEQAVLNMEIYAMGGGQGGSGDHDVFGYQERWAEYRYTPSMITGKFRSTDAQPLDAWHLAEHFTARPVLSQEFIESKPPVQRVVAVGAAAAGQEFIFDSVFRNRVVRPLPVYSVPGMIDHF